MYQKGREDQLLEVKVDQLEEAEEEKGAKQIISDQVVCHRSKNAQVSAEGHKLVAGSAGSK